MPLQSTEEFYKHLYSMANKYNRPGYSNFANELKTDVDDDYFNIQEIEFLFGFTFDAFRNIDFRKMTKPEMFDADKVLDYFEGFLVMYLMTLEKEERKIAERINRSYKHYKKTKELIDNGILHLDEEKLKWKKTSKQKETINQV